MKNLSFVILIASLLLLQACVSTNNVVLETNDIKMEKFSQITLSNREKPDFAAQTAGKAALGAFGAMGMISAGNKIISENEVEDPANFIANELATLLSEKHQIARVEQSETLVKGLKTQPVIKAYSNLGLLVDVQTINWSFGYFPTKWGKYRVLYTAKLRVIDSDAGELLAEGFCKRIPDYDETAPTKDELLADSAARLKSELKIAANSCIEQLTKNVFQF